MLVVISIPAVHNLASWRAAGALERPAGGADVTSAVVVGLPSVRCVVDGGGGTLGGQAVMYNDAISHGQACQGSSK